MHDFCKSDSVTTKDYDCENCLRCDLSGKTTCCVQECGFANDCPKACAKYRKYKVMEKWDTDKLIESLQDSILALTEEMPFSFDILCDRIKNYESGLKEGAAE